MKDLSTEFPDLLNKLLVAKINAGRLPVIHNPNVLTRKGEQVHLETRAVLLKEQVIREWRGGSSGFSFRIAKGVRYHVGSSRGRMVPVGTRIVPEDSGILSVTSISAAFLGQRSTIDMPYQKLLGFELFTDGIRMNLSNRKQAPIFHLDNAEVVAAMINGAMQRLD